MIHRILKIAAILLLSTVFFFSGITKLLNPAGFVQDIVNYRLFPLQPLHILAVWMIMLELFTAAGLWIPGLQRASAWIITGLMAFFIVIIGIAMARGLDISCGCFGPESQKVGWTKIIENTGLLAAGLYLLWPPRKSAAAVSPE